MSKSIFQLNTKSRQFWRRHQLLQVFEQKAFFLADVGRELLRELRQRLRRQVARLSQ